MKILLITILLAVHIYAQPSWYSTVPQNKYPTNDFFIGVYSSDKSFEDAQKNATKELTKQISVSVKSKENFKNKSIIENGKETISSEYTARTMLFSDLTLNNVKVGEKSKEDKKYYILVYLKKIDLINTLRNKIMLANDNLNDLLKNSAKDLSNGAVNSAVENLTKTNEIIWNSTESIKLLSVLTPLKESDKLIVTTNDIKSLFNKLSSKIDMIKISGDNQKILIGQKSSPIVVQLIEKSKKPISGLKIGFFYDDNLIAEVLTNKKGKASISFRPKNTDINTIDAKVIFDSPYSYVKKAGNRINTTFMLKPQKEEIKVKLKIKGSNIKTAEALENELNKIGVINDKKSKKIITVTINSKTLKDITSLKRIVIKEVNVEFIIRQALKAPKKYRLKLKGSGTNDISATVNAIKSIEFDNNFYNKLGINKKIEKNPIVAVISSPTNNSFYNNIEYAFKSAVENSLINSSLFDVVEREQLKNIISEINFQQSGMVNEKEIVEIGNFSGANFLIICNSFHINKNFNFSIKMIDVKTGKIIREAQTQGKGDQVNNIAKQLIQEIIY